MERAPPENMERDVGMAVVGVASDCWEEECDAMGAVVHVKAADWERMAVYAAMQRAEVFMVLLVSILRLLDYRR